MMAARKAAARSSSVPLKQLRKEASAAMRGARKTCSTAFREAREVARTRAQFMRAAELREAQRACDAAERAALEVVAIYQRARPPVTEAQRLSRARRAERRQFTERDATACIVSVHQVPEDVALRALRRVRRRVRGGERLSWERLCELVSTSDIAESFEPPARSSRRRRGDADRITIVDETTGRVYDADVIPF